MTKHKFFCINLKRRSDRKKNMEDVFQQHNIDCEFTEAVDGKELQKSDPRLKLFIKNNFKNRVGVIGCALSHIELYNRLISDDQNDYYVIFEDDIIMIPNFNDMLRKVFDKMSPDINIIYFGYHSNKLVQHVIDDISLKKMGRIVWGAYGYIISKKAARHIVDRINKIGVHKAIDHYLCISGLPIYLVEPCLVQIRDVPRGTDSDIQRDFTRIDIDDNL